MPEVSELPERSATPETPDRPPPVPGSGRGLHARLMPDYNRAAAAFWWAVVAAGGLILVLAAVWLGRQPWPTALQVAGGIALAVGSGLFPVRVPGTKGSFAVGEIFIFLVLLVHGPEAAAIVAAGETAVGAWRTSKRWTSRLFSPANSALAIWATGSLLQAALGRMAAMGWGGAAPTLAAVLAFAALYFFLHAASMAGLLRLKRDQRFLDVVDLLSVFRWVGMAYAGSAAVAALLAITYRQQGAGVLLVMLPLGAMLLVTLHFYFGQQEAGLALREAATGAAAREAAMAAQQAQAAERHLRALQASETRFHSAFMHAPIGMALLALDGRILLANPALAAVLGVADVALQQQRFQALVVAPDRALLEPHFQPAVPQAGTRFACELRCAHADGTEVWLALHCSAFTQPDSGAPCLILQAQDVSARRRAEAGLQHLAFHDPLTGLPNRRLFIDRLETAVARSQADPDPVHAWAVLFIDFDRFKLVNDSLGHSAGDELLLQMSRRVQHQLRPGDTVARLGGDEFAILALSAHPQHDAVRLAERLLNMLSQPFALRDTVPGGVELTASASIGITFSSQRYTSAEAVLRDADTAMYKAKSAGKARYALFDAGQHMAVAHRLRLEVELRRAIAQGELSVVYQPMFALRAGAAEGPGSAGAQVGVGAGPLSGFEALVRWQHPQHGLLAPAEFLPIAQESGLMLALSDFVLHRACRQLQQWQQSDPALAGLTMSINLSAHDLAHPGLLARVAGALQGAGVRPEHLTLELTEDILMQHIDGAMATLTALRGLGAQLAVDDFGTGYSSLSHLSRLPIDSLKIDRSFISGLQRGSADAAVVVAIIQLGGSLRKAVVAEGIESAEQMDHLRELGCGYGQGFHLATPLAEAAVTAWLRGPRGAAH